MGGLLRQPLLWFLLIGILLFVVDGRFAIDRNEIYVSAALKQRLATLWETQTGLTASQAELDSLVNSWIQEEVLYQEALRLGLDQEDSIIRRRLVQKLGFIAESEPTALPEAADLRAYYDANIEDYTLPIRYSFRQLYFRSESDALQALQQISQGVDATRLGESSMLNADYVFRSGLDLNASFGTGFADQLTGLETGGWQGPLVSGFGYHLIQLTTVAAEEVTPFISLQPQVMMDYQQFQQENARESYIDRLIDQYDIVREL